MIERFLQGVLGALWAFAIFVTAILVISLIAPYLPNWLFWIPSH